MNPKERDLLKQLLTEVRVLSVGVLVEKKPYVGVLPFVVTEDRKSVLVHASNLAAHSKGLNSNAPFSAAIAWPDSADIDPLQVPRLLVQGTVHVLQRDSEAYENGKSRYIGKFPGSTMTFSLGDFHLCRLSFERVRLVAGFGRALNVKLDELSDL